MILTLPLSFVGLLAALFSRHLFHSAAFGRYFRTLVVIIILILFKVLLSPISLLTERLHLFFISWDYFVAYFVSYCHLATGIFFFILCGCFLPYSGSECGRIFRFFKNIDSNLINCCVFLDLSDALLFVVTPSLPRDGGTA